MRKCILFIIALLGFLGSVYANSIDLNFYNDVIYRGESAKGYVLVEVNKTGYYIIDIYALGYEAWITKNFGEEYLNSLLPYNYSVSFTPPKNAKPEAYAIYVYLKDANGKILAQDKHIIHLIESPNLQINDVKLENPLLDYNEPLVVYVFLKNYGKVDAENHELVIKIPDLGIIKKVKLPVVEKESETTYRWDIILGESTPKTYKAIVELYDGKGEKVSEKVVNFEVKAKADVKEEVSEFFNLFRKKKVVV